MYGKYMRSLTALGGRFHGYSPGTISHWRPNKENRSTPPTEKGLLDGMLEYTL